MKTNRSSTPAKVFTIADVANQCHVTLRTIRFYEQRGLLTVRRNGTRRLFTSADIDSLKRICLLKMFGFTVREIKQTLDNGFPLPKIEDLEQQLDSLFRQRAELNRAISALVDQINLVSSEPTGKQERQVGKARRLVDVRDAGRVAKCDRPCADLDSGPVIVIERG